MCGRYASTRNPATLAVEFDAVDGTDDAAPGAAYNVAPTTPVLSVVTRYPRDPQGVPDPDRTVRSIRVMRWGLVPHWAKDPGVGSRLINARAESAASKPAFRDAVAKRRCLLPADGWYEWQRLGTRKQPFFITPADGSGLAMAGLWSTWRPPDATAPPWVTCAVLTTDAVGPLTEIHDRMPLILPPQTWQAWLDPGSDDPSELLAPPPVQLVHALELRPVSTAVNNVRRDGPELVERVEPEQPALLNSDGGTVDRAGDGGTVDRAGDEVR
ncbi:MAG: SOS response-associated peptidase [Pseudonocardiales bacterium]|nr:SOS response-associated peptidase [Pseudonocardiales bacterium]